jgi:hypothetical protein
MDVNETKNRCSHITIEDSILTNKVSYFSFVLIYKIAAANIKENQKYSSKSA